MQGIEEIRAELGDKTIMKKTDAPQFFEGVEGDPGMENSIIKRYMDNPREYKEKLERYQVMAKDIKEQQEKLKKQ